jgi:hypothetical protein
MRVRCHGKAYTEKLPSDGPGIVDVFTGRYQAMHVPSRDSNGYARCNILVTELHASLFF